MPDKNSTLQSANVNLTSAAPMAHLQLDTIQHSHYANSQAILSYPTQRRLADCQPWNSWVQPSYPRTPSPLRLRGTADSEKESFPKSGSEIGNPQGVARLTLRKAFSVSERNLFPYFCSTARLDAVQTFPEVYSTKNLPEVQG